MTFKLINRPAMRTVHSSDNINASDSYQSLDKEREREKERGERERGRERERLV